MVASTIGILNFTPLWGVPSTGREIFGGIFCLPCSPITTHVPPRRGQVQNDLGLGAVLKENPAKSQTVKSDRIFRKYILLHF